MADPLDVNAPASPTPVAQPNVAALADQWRQFLGDPASRTALIQFGAQLAQPMGFGQTPLGHFSRAVGAGGEAATRVGEIERKDQEAESRNTKREADAQAVISRAQTAEANANTAAARQDSAAARAQAAIQSAGVLDQLRTVQMETERSRQNELNARAERARVMAELYPQSQEAQNEYRMAQAEQARAGAALRDTRREAIPLQTGIQQQNADTRQRAQENRTITNTQKLEQGDRALAQRDEASRRREYETSKRAYEKEITNRSFTGQKSNPFPTFEDWNKQYPSRGGGSPAQPSPQNAPPPAPLDPAQRQIDIMYQTPQGPLRWKGNGWEQP